MKIRGIIEALLSSHERGSDDYIAGYILRSSEGRLGQEQAQHFATIFNDYAQFIYTPVKKWSMGSKLALAGSGSHALNAL